MTGKKEIYDALAALKVIIYVYHKDTTKVRRPVGAVLSHKGEFFKDEFNKFLSTAISQSLPDVNNETTWSMKGGIGHYIQADR